MNYKGTQNRCSIHIYMQVKCSHKQDKINKYLEKGKGKRKEWREYEKWKKIIILIKRINQNKQNIVIKNNEDNV